jgi:hypothetical protein
MAAVQRGMIDLDPTIFHHLLELAVADRIRHIPPHAPQDDVRSKWLPLKSIAILCLSKPVPIAIQKAPAQQNFATEPISTARESILIQANVSTF